MENPFTGSARNELRGGGGLTCQDAPRSFQNAGQASWVAMNTPLRFPLRETALFCGLGLAAFAAQAAVLPLGFDGGAGTSGIDQYTGASGGGWNSAWSTTFHSGTANTGATVSSASPLTVGGGNYLQLGFDTAASGARLARHARQWDTSAISLTDPFTFEFDFRSNVNVASATQTLLLFGSSASATGTGSADSWKIAADGSGWSAFNGTTAVSLGAGAVKANETWHFSLTIDPVSDTYSVSVQNLTTAASTFTVSGLALRNGADSSLAWLNFHANGAASQTGLGFAVDSLAITSTAIPEPSGAAVLAGGLALGGTVLRRRRRAA